MKFGDKNKRIDFWRNHRDRCQRFCGSHNESSYSSFNISSVGVLAPLSRPSGLHGVGNVGKRSKQASLVFLGLQLSKRRDTRAKEPVSDSICGTSIPTSLHPSKGGNKAYNVGGNRVE